MAIEARKHLESCQDISDVEPVVETDEIDDLPDGWAEQASGAKVISLHTRRLPADPRSSLPE
ncbi:hypothetical protein [Streptomyces sp. TR06-5]|uniref:hypothetical protein n=1 Tax=unclassified Streptomyces TaxID=2593676 RepID=UPI0039A1E4AD